ncbi:MAG: acyl-CoA dehydrogenase family protein [Pseudomonadota bacterium]
MLDDKPKADLATHRVTNQPPPFENINLFETDHALQDAVRHFSTAKHENHLTTLGSQCGNATTQLLVQQANQNPPSLHAFDQFGHRIDEVAFHPAYHDLMKLGIESGVTAVAWLGAEDGHVVHGAMMILLNQSDAGVTCPMSMTYASVAALAKHPTVGEPWIEKIRAQSYDSRCIPAPQKSGVTIGMAMTEKQGGSDVRANTTRAVPDGSTGYRITGHKWFCSAPMSDAFLTLANTDKGLTCFLVPRWTPDGERNAIHLMRLKDKLGDRSNASSEIEYHGAWAERIGEEGRGINTIIDMVQHTRYDCALGSTGGMRATLTQALWHTTHRSAFGHRLIEQPAMRSVLADLIIDYEAAVALALRIGASIDATTDSDADTALMRIAIPAAKYWICKRQPAFVYEALECLGGAGFVEESPLPRLFRQSPLNAIWEGSGNVIAIDILRAIKREPDCIEALYAELSPALGRHLHYDRLVTKLKSVLSEHEVRQENARGIAQSIALALQGAALAKCAPDFVFESFCAQRLAADQPGSLYGSLQPGVATDELVKRSASEAL